jgi:hypothetical protein
MPAVQYNIKIERGTDYSLPIRWGKNNTLGVFEPYDLTGCQARMHVREEVDSATPVDTLTTENGRIILDALNGKLTLVFSNVITATAAWGEGVYHLEIIDSLGKVRRLAKGTISIDAEVTR